MMPFLPEFGAGLFRRGEPIDNPYMPLVPGTALTYTGTDTDGEVVEENDVFTTQLTKNVLDVQTTVVRDTAYEDGRIVEETIDFFAQDESGNVWYFGEEVINYRYNARGEFIGTDSDGAWLAGENDAKPGWVMTADPTRGFSYYNEFAPGVALDETRIIGLDVPVEIGLGGFRTLKTLDSTALEPGALEFKYYAPLVGLVRVEEGLSPNNPPELVVELRDIVRTGTSILSEDAEVVDAGNFISDGKARWVTIVDEDSDLDNALGYYTFDPKTGVIGEGRILSTDADAGDTVRIRVPEGSGVGLFLVPNGAELGVDLGDYRSGGLFFENMLTGNAARLSNKMAPIVVDADGDPLPISIFHALGGAQGSNLLNPGLGLGAVEYESDDFNGQVEILGFEDRRATQADFDGDYNDVLIAFSDARLEEADFAELMPSQIGDSGQSVFFETSRSAWPTLGEMFL